MKSGRIERSIRIASHYPYRPFRTLEWPIEPEEVVELLVARRRRRGARLLLDQVMGIPCTADQYAVGVRDPHQEKRRVAAVRAWIAEFRGEVSGKAVLEDANRLLGRVLYRETRSQPTTAILETVCEVLEDDGTGAVGEGFREAAVTDPNFVWGDIGRVRLARGQVFMAWGRHVVRSYGGP